MLDRTCRKGNRYKLWGVWACACMLNRFSAVRLFGNMDCSLPGSSVHEIFQARYWRRMSCPPSGHPLGQGVKPASLMSSTLVARFFITTTTWEGPVWAASTLIHKPRRPLSLSGLCLANLSGVWSTAAALRTDFVTTPWDPLPKGTSR